MKIPKLKKQSILKDVTQCQKKSINKNIIIRKILNLSQKLMKNQKNLVKCIEKIKNRFMKGYTRKLKIETKNLNNLHAKVILIIYHI